jgi:IS30 family transposase
MSYKHFTRDDRVALAALLKAHKSYETISDILGFNPTTIGREAKSGGGKNKYSVRVAQAKADQKRLEANQCHRKLGKDLDLTETVQVLLELEWSPEQIVGRMRLEQELGLITKDLNIASATTIYTWANPQEKIAALLPRKHNKYRRTKDASKRA